MSHYVEKFMNSWTDPVALLDLLVATQESGDPGNAALPSCPKRYERCT